MTNPARRQQIAEAAARLKARRKEAGLVRLELWIRKENVEAVKAAASKIEETK